MTCYERTARCEVASKPCMGLPLLLLLLLFVRLAYDRYSKKIKITGSPNTAVRTLCYMRYYITLLLLLYYMMYKIRRGFISPDSGVCHDKHY